MGQGERYALGDAPAGWEWPDEIDPRTLRRMAAVTGLLFERPERWIHRRVERISFKDHQVAHHRISVDFTLPAQLQEIDVVAGKAVYLAPLFLLLKGVRDPLCEGKRPRRRYLPFGERRGDLGMRPIPAAPYSNIDVIDDNGRSVSLLTRRQSTLLAETILCEAAERVLASSLDDELRSALSAVAYRSWPELGNVFEFLLVTPAADPEDPRHRLRLCEAFTELVHTLASHSMIACLVVGQQAPRQLIYKLSYDEQLGESSATLKSRLGRSLGIGNEEYLMPLSEIGAASSYHVETTVPTELMINAEGLVGKRYERFGQLLDDDNLDYCIQQVQATNEGKIYIPSPLPGRRVGFAWVKLRARRTGLMVGALVTSLVITGMLAVAIFAAPIVVDNNESESAAAALLLIPAVVAVYIARPGEHPVTATILSSARIWLVINAILPVIAVFFLVTRSTGKGSASLRVGHYELGHSSIPWIVLAAASAVLTLLFALSCIFPKPRGETIYWPMPPEVEGE